MCKKVSSPSETATATEGKKNSSTLMIRDAVRGFAIGIHREEEDGPAKRESNATGIAIRRRIVCAGRGRAGDSAALRRFSSFNRTGFLLSASAYCSWGGAKNNGMKAGNNDWLDTSRASCKDPEKKRTKGEGKNKLV